MKTKKEQKKRRNIVSVVYWFADVIQYSWTIVALRVTGGPRWLPPVHAYLCKVCQWLAAGRLFSPGTTVSSTNKTDNHDITELLFLSKWFYSFPTYWCIEVENIRPKHIFESWKLKSFNRHVYMSDIGYGV
jgi:hypothetical protein